MIPFQRMSILSNNTLVILLTLLLALPILSTDIYLPSLTEMAQYFHASYNQIQLTMTLYFLTFAFVQLIYGPLSDCFGRKPLLLLSMYIYVGGSLLCAFATSINIFIIGRCLQALGAGSAILIFAIIRDLYEQTHAAQKISFMSAVVAVSPIIAPIIGGYIQLLTSWRGDFFCLFIIGLILLIICHYLLPETNQYRCNNVLWLKQSIKDYKLLLIDRNYINNACAAAFAFGALFAYISGAPYVLMALRGYSPQIFGWLFAIAATGYVAGSLINSKFVSQFGLNYMGKLGAISLISGSIIMMLLCCFYPLTSMGIVLPQIICEFGISIIVSIYITKAMQPIPQKAGAGSALIGFLRFMAATLSSYFVMKYHGKTPLYLTLIILIFSLFSLGFVYCEKIINHYQKLWLKMRWIKP